MNSIVTTLLLFSRKGKKIQMLKLNFNELCLIVKITKNSDDWLSNIMIHVCSGFWETRDIDAYILLLLFWLQSTEISICWIKLCRAYFWSFSKNGQQISWLEKNMFFDAFWLVAKRAALFILFLNDKVCVHF